MRTKKHEIMLLDKEKKFEEIFRTYFKELHGYAFKILGDSNTAEETVQQVFLKLWEKNAQRSIHTSIRSYLYRSVYNESVNVLKRDKYKVAYQTHQRYVGGNDSYVPQSDRELRKQLYVALSQLPEKSRKVFEMSRFQDMRYQEIADELALSLKTVEGHMTKVLKHLRIHLADYLNLLALMMMTAL